MQTIVLPHRPHKGQKWILGEAERFNVVVCGRRFGKTTLAEHITYVSSLSDKGLSIGWFLPTYKDLSKVWRTVKLVLRDLISEKNEQLKELYFYSGAQIDFWSTENPDSGRGREYDVAVVDETQKHKKLKYFWENTLFPTLTKTKGTAWFFGTIDAPDSVFHELFKKAEREEYWKSFSAPTSLNPFISREELDLAQRTLGDVVYQREYEAKWVRSTSAIMFVTTPIKREYQPLRKDGYKILSFDNNYNPLVCQLIDTNADFTYWNWFQTIKQYNTSIGEFLPYLDVELHKLGVNLRSLLITGDPNANNTNVMARGNLSMFEEIKNYFGLANSQFKLVNHISHENHRTMFNSVIHKHPNMVINPENVDLIYDFENVTMKERLTGGRVKLEINKDRSDKSKEADALDCARYAGQAFLYDKFS